MTEMLPADPFVIVDVPLAEDHGGRRLSYAVPVEARGYLLDEFRRGLAVLDDDEDLEFIHRGERLYIPKASLSVAIRQLEEFAL